MNGVGVIIILLQINPMLGQKGLGKITDAIVAIPQSIAHLNPAALGLSAATLAILYLTPKKLSRLVPTSLLALVVLTPICYAMSLDAPTIGAIPTGFASFTVPVPNLTHIGSIVGYGLILAILGTIDSLLTSLVADSITKTKHSSNQELIGQGIGNALVGFVGGISGAGATMRTVANIKAGGLGRLSGITHSVFLLLAVLVFARAVAYVPLAVLAGILIKVGVDILDYRMLRRLNARTEKRRIRDDRRIFANGVCGSHLCRGRGRSACMDNVLCRFAQRQKEICYQTLYLDDAKFVEIIGPIFFTDSARIVDDLRLRVCRKKLTIDFGQATFIDISFAYALEDFFAICLKKCYKCGYNHRRVAFLGKALNELKNIYCR